ncbi:ubiquitin-conjugating enzyme/RWD-like protein [Catenaria anguillulae PL171]|uniref:Ubiquitin-conjugating enzyme/RWD-like protein n=1 Tax=Catenaria anguillulae PL171 TaxID=765915 RepID=A0A1Y2HM14_9FUNG|nr:ubiquitin-conjugating enzyme/RWD-like protein [Catenaria anguillulae PL171]
MTAPTAKTPNIRRVLKEIQELEADSSDRYAITIPFEDDIFQLHFTIRGPSGTPYEAGVYHGRLVLPPQYPFKPPEIYFLTPNGRFETKTKICLSISSFHEETWNPSWGLRTMLLGIASFMAFESEGAIGSVRWTDDERRNLAKVSHTWTCSECGQANEAILPVCGELRPLSDKDKGEPGLEFVYERDREKQQVQPRAGEADSGLGDVRDGESGTSASEAEDRDAENRPPSARAAIEAPGSAPPNRIPSPSSSHQPPSSSPAPSARPPGSAAPTTAASQAHAHEQSQAKLDVMIVAVLFVIIAILLRKIL